MVARSINRSAPFQNPPIRPATTVTYGLRIGSSAASGHMGDRDLNGEVWRNSVNGLVAGRLALASYTVVAALGCKVFLMNLWAILLTATVGLAGGQIGAWLQGRRDTQAQMARERSEIERLRLQLIR